MACVAAVSFSFPGGDQKSERKSGRGKEHAWGEQKIGEKWGRSEREGGGGGEKKIGVFPSLASPPPSAPYISQSLPVSSLRVSFWKRLLRRLFSTAFSSSLKLSLSIFFSSLLNLKTANSLLYVRVPR